MKLPALAVVATILLSGSLLTLRAAAPKPASPKTSPASRAALKVVEARDSQTLREALGAAKPGTVITLAPGEYTGGLFAGNIHGTAEQPIVVRAQDPENPPVFKGGSGMHLTEVSHLELHDLQITGASQNGINIDDGGTYDTPAHHIRLKGLKISDVGPMGNHDAIKISGLDDFRIENCRLETWGTGSGSGIDMVGCHRGVIENNLFRDREEDYGKTGGNAVQTKGGTSQITIRRNRFEHAGSRAINVGGSTGLAFFRPPLKEQADEVRYEARDILVEGNTFIGSDAPLAFVGVDGAVARFNTIYKPRRWAIRILQETTGPGFVPCRNVEFSHNIVVFDPARWAEGGVNIGPGTQPETFKFEGNFWSALGRPDASRPRLPSVEKKGIYGQDPQFKDVEKLNLVPQEGSPAAAVGASALPAVAADDKAKG